MTTKQILNNHRLIVKWTELAMVTNEWIEILVDSFVQIEWPIWFHYEFSQMRVSIVPLKSASIII